MARVVVWSPRAIEDVDDIAGYISQDSEVYAASVVRSILRKARGLAEHPFMGRVVPEFGDETVREIFCFSYRIIYKIENESVTVAAVIHGKREMDLAIGP